jgi:hemolysin activation/secretion protein
MTPDLPPNPPDNAPVAAIVAPAPKPESIVVESHGYRYVIAGNVLLPQATIVTVVEGAEDPKQAVDRLKLAYQQAGYPLIAVGGQVSNKLVAIQVINGRITEKDITPPSLAPYFAGIEGREDLHRNTLIRKVAMAELFAARDGMRPAVNFAPAQEVGGTKIIVTEEPIEGAKRWNANLAFGNLGSRFSSRYLAQVAGAVRPGEGLELTASYGQGIPGLTADSGGSSYKNAVVGASLVTPLGLYGVSFSQVDYGIGEATAPLFPQGDISIGSITGTQLVYADETARWTVNEGYTHVDNVVKVFEGVFTLTDQHYDLVSAGTGYNKSFALLGQNANVGVGLTVSRGLAAPKGTFLPVGPGIADPRFTQIQASLNYVQSLPEGYSLTVNWSGQWADTTVPQNQQWVLGGFGNLTAWLPAVMVGDGGSLFRAAVATAPWQWQGISVAGSAFVEAGLVNTHFTPAGQSTNRAASDAGLSLSGSFTGGTSLTLAYAWPLATRNVELATLDAQGRAYLYFTLNQSF